MIIFLIVTAESELPVLRTALHMPEEIRKQAELAEKLMYGPAPLSGTIKNEDQPQRQLLSWEQEYRTRRRQ